MHTEKYFLLEFKAEATFLEISGLSNFFSTSAREYYSEIPLSNLLLGAYFSIL